MTERNDDPSEVPARIQAGPLAAGLYFVSTPIGSARDITLRALDVLNTADLLAAEDTRTLRHLLDIHGVPLRGRRVIACHDHNETKRSATLMAALREGNSVAYCSDAGTPLVADPGFRLARDAAAQGSPIHAVPGPSAAIAALTVSGLPSDRFVFAGFPPQSAGARRRWLEELSGVDATAIIFESPRRIKQTLDELCEIEANRNMVLCRELTKKFEEIMRGSVAEIADRIPDVGLKGEVVIVLDKPRAKQADQSEIEAVLAAMLSDMTLRDAAAAVAERYGMAKRDAYQLALSLGKDR
ncbi:16S rRNA (cytidine(1402)-2'-O)-methyltransferase [Paracoccus sediminicola]|uniref:16S rRNA (cytidine(1402)-2'-O)-methyltransferase n=1 Tax=Paracoccus sediminicola TaxID=3017783 RepID=UPI003EB7B8FC